MRIIGQGGASVVYLARQEPFDREVAVKVLRRDVDQAKVWARFLREARTVARLSGHPHVLTVHAAGRAKGGEPYLVTEYLDRGSLGDVVAAEGPLPAAMVVRVGAAIADALAAAHGIGILHRDVKPGNVLLGHDGRVKLGDFGIARLLAGQSVTSTDSIAFTPEHVAPEILRGQVDGAWSDLYGLASSLAAALIGAPLFQRRPDERIESLLSRKLMAPPPPLPPAVPGGLADLLTWALDPEPSRRPSLEEFRRQLTATAERLGAELPRPLPPPPATATAPLSVIGDTLAEIDYNSGEEPTASRLGALRRHGRPLAISAFVIALVGAVLAVAVLLRGDDERGEASSTTSAIAVAPTTVATEQTSAPPITAAPVTTATPTGPVAAIVPATTPSPAPTVTIAPATTPSPAPTVTTTPVTEEPGPITAEEAATFVREYFDAVAAGDYQTSWARLAPEFQRGMARSYEYYVDFWNDNDVEPGDVQLVDSDEDRAVVNVPLRWNGSSAAQLTQFTLRPDESGDLLIMSQSSVGG